MLLKYCNYNAWANQKIINCILAAGEEVSDMEFPSSFNTIRKTLYHIWDAQLIWCSRLQGAAFKSWPSKDFKGTLEEACKGIVVNSREIVSIAEQFNKDYTKSIIYKTLDGKEYSNTVEDILMHCINHGTYHRGQIITLLRQAGTQKVDSTDYIRFCREIKSIAL